ncbi:MAG: rod shape-determining protein RodA, partial [Alphaproteobacteria bacterium]|nr:rod shape-determining protein RodA [Alphaproteobacteria bacterium]
MSVLGERHADMTLLQKIRNANWLLILLLGVAASVGFAMLYSAAGGHVDPWASRQTIRFGLGVSLMMAAALVDIRIWMRVAYPFYALALILLIAVDAAGSVGMGAQRWLDLGVINLQPSELMRIALVLALARYFHTLSYEDVGRIRWLIVPVVMIVAPTALVLVQPDMGTAMLTLLGGAAVLFVVGVRWWKFALVFVLGLGVMP